MGEFDRLWQFIIKRTIETLSPYERAKYEKLHTPPQQEAFFIVRSFALLGKGQDFPVAQLSLADRLGVTQQGAGYVIEKLIGLGAIKKMADARINSKSATYHWTANHDSP
jgi:DNA-binding MarR family transcriptional regulator